MTIGGRGENQQRCHISETRGQHVDENRLSLRTNKCKQLIKNSRVSQLLPT